MYRSFAYGYILSISGSWSIELSNAFGYSDPEPIINIMHGWSGICGQNGLRVIAFSPVTLSKLIFYIQFFALTNCNNSSLDTFPTFIPYGYDFTLLNDCILL